MKVASLGLGGSISCSIDGIHGWSRLEPNNAYYCRDCIWSIDHGGYWNDHSNRFRAEEHVAHSGHTVRYFYDYPDLDSLVEEITP